MYMNKVLGFIIFILVIVIAVMAWLLFVQPVHAPTTSELPPPVQDQQTASTTTQAPAPLHTKVVVDSPKASASVGKTFDVTGQAPGNWYFEATFPIQVRDPADNVIGRNHADALGDWQTTEQVQFKSTINIDGNYTGPATLILMKDNPSGLPENDDSLEIPIVIK
jgi:hypothetical protein